MPLNFLHPDSAREFLDLARESLEIREAENGLILGVCMRQMLWNDPNDPTWYMVATQNGEVQSCAIKSQHHNLLLHFEAGKELEQGEAVAHHVKKIGLEFPGIFGPKAGVTSFLKTWEDVTAEKMKFNSGMRTFRLDQIEHMGNAPGGMRPAKIPDTRLLIQWFVDFYAEAIHDQQLTEEYLTQEVKRRIENQEIFLWENEGPVCMASSNRPTRNGISIGYVYTPPKNRKNGYGTSLTAHLSRHLMEEQKYKFCTLFTDLANPTSNAIYQKIGYQSLSDFLLYIRP